MKKLFFLCASALLFVSASQAQTTMATPNGLGLDTVTNTATKAALLKVPGYQKTVAVQANVTKISGTVGGTATLQGSLDGVNYYTITGATAFTLTDVAAQGQLWTLVDPGCLYYRVLFAGSGTMSVSVSATLLSRKLTYQ